MIEARGIYKSFGKNQVLEGVDLSLSPGQVTAVLGPNGSGKTTLMKAILGMVLPQQGEILVDGVSVKGTWDYRRHIGYLPQIARFPENLKVKELIHMVHDIRGNHSNEHELLQRFELEPYIDKPLRYLSGGTRQKINIVLAFMFDSRFYILDEPTAGLDPVALIRFKELLRHEKERGKAILLTTHIITLVEEMADEIVFLLEGKVYYRGTLSGLKPLEGSGISSLEQAIASILIKEKHV
jgi:Cu-processing system ATP-binding protein